LTLDLPFFINNETPEFDWAILSGFEVLDLGINESTYQTSSKDMSLDGNGICLFSNFMDYMFRESKEYNEFFPK
jgi:hypothetical protein